MLDLFVNPTCQLQGGALRWWGRVSSGITSGRAVEHPLGVLVHLAHPMARILKRITQIHIGRGNPLDLSGGVYIGETARVRPLQICVSMLWHNILPPSQMMWIHDECQDTDEQGKWIDSLTPWDG